MQQLERTDRLTMRVVWSLIVVTVLVVGSYLLLISDVLEGVYDYPPVEQPSTVIR